MDYIRVLIVLIFFPISVDTLAAVSVIQPNTANTLSSWVGANVTNASGNAVASKSLSASFTTLLGKNANLPGTVTATVPRASLAATASKVLLRGSAIGLVGFGLYDLLHTSTGVNADGTLTQTTQTDLYEWTVLLGDCGGHRNYTPANGTTAGLCQGYVSFGNACVNQYYPTSGYLYVYVSSTPGHCVIDLTRYGTQHGVTNYDNLVFRGQTTTETTNPTESELTAKIQASPATEKQLFDSALADAVNHTYNDLNPVPTTTPATVTGSPVVGPEEEVSTSTSPNPDGSTSTTTKKTTTTATPTNTGTTADTVNQTWSTTNTDVTTVTNNTTNVTTTTTTTTNDGTSTTKPESDLCKLHPEIASCATLGTAPETASTPVGTHDLAINLTTPASVAGTCPSPVTMEIHPPYLGTKTLTISYQPVCNIAAYMRYITLAIAWLVAGFIVTGANRKAG